LKTKILLPGSITSTISKRTHENTLDIASAYQAKEPRTTAQKLRDKHKGIYFSAKAEEFL